MHKQLRAALVAALVMAALGGTTYAVAAGEGRPILGGQRNPSPNPAQSLTRETEIIADTSTYGTRQSNKSNNGGGAIYGCRSLEGGTPADREPCIRSNNLSRGLSFEFETDGAVAGTITTAGGDTSRPFTTNATGVATGLNADRVDSLSADQIVALARAKANLDADTVDGLNSTQLRTRWAYVNEAGAIVAQSGGFTVLDCYQTNNNCYLGAGDDLTDNGITATIAIRNIAADAAPANFGGEISVSRCQIPNVVECAPANSKTTSALVVSPRESDGSPTLAGARKAFYVSISE